MCKPCGDTKKWRGTAASGGSDGPLLDFLTWNCGLRQLAAWVRPRGRLCSSGIHGVTRGCLGVLLIKLFDNLRTLDNRKAQANRGQGTTDAAFRISDDKRDRHQYFARRIGIVPFVTGRRDCFCLRSFLGKACAWQASLAYFGETGRGRSTPGS